MMTNATHSPQSADKPVQVDDIYSQLLVKIANNRNKSDFIPLFKHYAPMMKAYAKRMGLVHKAEEMTQEIMLQIWQKAGKYNPDKSSATTWIYRVARNLMIDELRLKRGEEISIESDEIWYEEETREPLVCFQRYSTQKHLRQSIETLPFEQKDLISQVYLSGKTQKQIAEESGVPLGTIKSRIRLALGKMKLTLKKFEL